MIRGDSTIEADAHDPYVPNQAMSIPRKHHYLPQFYLERWARDGEVIRYVRPLGNDGPLDCRGKAPKGIAYERDLYQLPDIPDLAESQQIEMRFFQEVDDRAATALQRVDANTPLSLEDRTALARFMVSLLHRSPSRLGAIRRELLEKREGAPFRDLEGDELDRAVKAMSNRLLENLVGSDYGADLLTRLVPHPIIINGASKALMTSDRPVSVSGQLVSSDAFMILPYGPDRMIVFTRKADVARSFATQDKNILVKGINGAVVEQAEDIIVAADRDAYRMVDRLFLRPQPGMTRDPVGLIRRKAPFVDLFPKLPNVSRHRKNDLKYRSL